MELDPDEDNQPIGEDWHIGKLKFRKHIDDYYRNMGMGGDGRSQDDYRVVDPRLKHFMEKG